MAALPDTSVKRSVAVPISTLPKWKQVKFKDDGCPIYSMCTQTNGLRQAIHAN